jgi:hypothetical protein
MCDLTIALIAAEQNGAYQRLRRGKWGDNNQGIQSLSKNKFEVGISGSHL